MGLAVRGRVTHTHLGWPESEDVATLPASTLSPVHGAPVRTVAASRGEPRSSVAARVRKMCVCVMRSQLRMAGPARPTASSKSALGRPDWAERRRHRLLRGIGETETTRGVEWRGVA